MDFSGFSSWGIVSVVAVLLVALLLANMLKRRILLLQKSLIPTSVLAGAIILIISCIYTAIAGEGEYLFELKFFGSPSKETLQMVEAGLVDKNDVALTGLDLLEVITYHALALGFIATAFKPIKEKISKKRSTEIFNTGVSTVSTYLLQAVIGITITMIGSLFITGLANYGGVILAFGYGQGTGQALNYGSRYEASGGFLNGTDFGLSIASLGFIFAAVGGVLYLNHIKRKSRKKMKDNDFGETITIDKIQTSEELPMESSGVDKNTMQLAFILGSYFATYGILYILGKIMPSSMLGTVYGFNFLIGVLVATLVCFILRFFKKRQVIKHEYINHFLMKRWAGFFFDIMIIAGFAAIKPDTILYYWHILLIIGFVGALASFFYLRLISKLLFKKYSQEQFLAMYGMLTGTASTGIVLLREWDPNFRSPAADNLVYQNFPAIVFGLPILFLAAVDVISVHPYIIYGVFIGLFVIMNLILFRSYIFKRRKKETGHL